MEESAKIKYDGPTLTAGAVAAIAILRALGRVNDGDELTPARICELIGCAEPDEHGLPPREWLPVLDESIEDPERRACSAAIELVVREVDDAADASGGGTPWIYAEAYAILAGAKGADGGLPLRVLFRDVKLGYDGAEKDRSLH